MLPPGFILLALCASLLIGVADYIYGRAVRSRVSPGTITVSQASFVVPATWLWAQGEGAYAWTPPAFWGIAAAFFTFTGFWSFMKSVELGEASVSTPIYRMSFVVTALLPSGFWERASRFRKSWASCSPAAPSSRSRITAPAASRPGSSPPSSGPRRR